VPRLILLLAALSALALGVATAGAGPDDERSHADPCKPLKTIQGPLGNETVLATDFISCERATKILKRHDDDVDPETAFTEGAHFRLGNWRCGVRKFFTESAKARCQTGDPMFRIDYGY